MKVFVGVLFALLFASSARAEGGCVYDCAYLRSIKTFAYLVGYEFTTNLTTDFALTENDLTNQVVLSVRNNLRDIPYKEVPFAKAKNDGTEGRIYCRAMGIKGNTVSSYHVKCGVGLYGDDGRTHLWEKEFLGLSDNSRARENIKKLIDSIIQDFAAEFYRAKAKS